MTRHYRLHRWEEAPRTEHSHHTIIGPVVLCRNCGAEMQLAYRYGDGPPHETLKPLLRRAFHRGAIIGLVIGGVVAFVLGFSL